MSKWYGCRAKTSIIQGLFLSTNHSCNKQLNHEMENYIFSFGVCFGIMDECWKDWLDRSRTAEVWDVAMDACGVFAGLVVSMIFWKK